MSSKNLKIFFLSLCCASLCATCKVEKSIVLEINSTQKQQNNNVNIVYNKEQRNLYYKYVNKYRNKIISDFVKESHYLDTFYLLEVKSGTPFNVQGYIWNSDTYISYEVDDFKKNKVLKKRINREDFVKPSIKDFVQRVESNHFTNKDRSEFSSKIGGPVIVLIRVVKNKEKIKVNVEQFYS